MSLHNQLSHYPEAQVHHLEDIGSDHRPNLLSLNPNTPKANQYFKFDKRQSTNADIENIINSVWNSRNRGEERQNSDDTIIYAKASSHEAEQIRRILNIYEHTSGQSFNFSKSRISFSPNTPNEIWLHIASILHINHLEAPDKFLGLPLEISKTKRQFFSLFKDRITSKTTSKTTSWKE